MYEYANNTTNNEIKFTKNLVCFATKIGSEVVYFDKQVFNAS